MAVRFDEAGCRDVVFYLSVAGAAKIQLDGVSAFSFEQSKEFSFNVDGPGGEPTSRTEGVSSYSGSITMTAGLMNRIRAAFPVPNHPVPKLTQISSFYPFLTLQMSYINGKVGERSMIIPNIAFLNDGASFDANTSESQKYTINIAASDMIYL